MSRLICFTIICGLVMLATMQAQTTGTVPIPEVSGVVDIGGDRVVFVADEGYDIQILSGASAALKSGTKAVFDSNLKPAIAGITISTSKKTVNDCEDVTWDAVGRFVYVITSHSVNSAQEVKPARYKLVRLSLDKVGAAVAVLDVDTLKEAFKKSFPIVGEKTPPHEAGGDNGTFNIEGLAFEPAKARLLIGLRSPTARINGKSAAIVLALNNPNELFGKQDPPAPKFAANVHYLDLEGQGIRGLAYDQITKGFWIISGRSDDADPKPSTPASPATLWFWVPGETGESSRLIKTSFTSSLNVEGISTLRLDGKDGLLMVSDDGDGPDTSVSRYVWIPLPLVSVQPVPPK